jgi:hypothetical protein
MDLFISSVASCYTETSLRLRDYQSSLSTVWGICPLRISVHIPATNIQHKMNANKKIDCVCISKHGNNKWIHIRKEHIYIKSNASSYPVICHNSLLYFGLHHRVDAISHSCLGSRNVDMSERSLSLANQVIASRVLNCSSLCVWEYDWPMRLKASHFLGVWILCRDIW